MKRDFESYRGEQDGLWADAARTAFVLGVWGWELLAEAAGRTFGKVGAAAPPPSLAPVEARVVAGEPKTLREIGLDGALVAEFEDAFRRLGVTEGDRVIGYRFRTPAGVSHALRLESPGEDRRSTLDRAA